MFKLLQKVFGQSRVSVVTVITYSVVLHSLRKGPFARLSLDNASKVVSFSHSLVISLAAIYTLSAGDWALPDSQEQAAIRHEQAKNLGSYKDRKMLDDTQNIIINGRSSLAKGLLAWEAGYLLYDTIVLFVQSQQRHKASGYMRLIGYTISESTDVFVHHVLIFFGLASLPTYFLNRRELGTWVFTSFLLMNASTPLLHARTWFRRRYGRQSEALEFSFILLFAATRFGLVYWVIRKYAQYHYLETWNAFKSLYLICRTGTVALVGFNAIWWVTLVRRFVKRIASQGQKHGKLP